MAAVVSVLFHEVSYHSSVMSAQWSLSRPPGHRLRHFPCVKRQFTGTGVCSTLRSWLVSYDEKYLKTIAYKPIQSVTTFKSQCTPKRQLTVCCKNKKRFGIYYFLWKFALVVLWIYTWLCKKYFLRVLFRYARPSYLPSMNSTSELYILSLIVFKSCFSTRERINSEFLCLQTWQNRICVNCKCIFQKGRSIYTKK